MAGFNGAELAECPPANRCCAPMVWFRASTDPQTLPYKPEIVLYHFRLRMTRYDLGMTWGRNHL
jgi:hypothetical protein